MKLRNAVAITLVIAFFCWLSGCASTGQEQQKEADFSYRMGVAYFNEGRIQMAFIEFQKALQLTPDNKDILNSLGLVYLKLENYDKARELFLKAISLDPGFSDAYNNLGVTYVQRKQWPEAVQAFKKALSNPLYTTPDKALDNLGLAYYRIGQLESAIAAFKEAIKRAPSLPLSYYYFALALNKAGRYGDAATVITEAIELDSSYKGDKTKFAEDLKKRLPTASGDEASDFKDYLEIMKY